MKSGPTHFSMPQFFIQIFLIDRSFGKPKKLKLLVGYLFWQFLTEHRIP